MIITATHLFTSFTYGNQPQAAEAKVTSRLCMNMLVGQRQSLDFGPGEGGISLHFSDIENTILPRLETIGGSYSWIGRPMQANKKIICRKTERATTDLNILMKSSQRGASNGAGHNVGLRFLESYS